MRGIITLCGSTKFKKEYLEWQWKLTLAGYVVLTVGGWPHAEGWNITPEEKQLVDRLHIEKISMSEAIYVINPGGYVGESTRREIDYAVETHKRVYFMGEQPWT